MRIFALELNNEIKGISERKQYIESLIARLPSPDFVVLPELSICSYMADQRIWQYSDHCGKATAEWAMAMAQKYRTYIGVGYLDRENGDYFNRYMIADKNGICGIVTKSEGESAVFKRGWFNSNIMTPFGNVGVAICYDAKRRHFYENVKTQELSLILFPHGCPADPKKAEEEEKNNEFFCKTYMEAFGVPVVYVNSIGKLENMPGKMGRMMAGAGFRMNGKTEIYYQSGSTIVTGVNEAKAANLSLTPQKLKKDIRFYGDDLIKGNWLFRQFILKPDTQAGIKAYKRNHDVPI